MNLFEKLPDEIFRPLAASKRRFYAALLLHLHDHSFDAVGDTPRKADILEEIGAFVDRHVVSGDEWSDESESDLRALALKEAKGQDVRRYEAYHLLVRTGWFIELRDRYRKLVDLSPEGRLLLQEFKRIASGDARSYGGLVLNVFGNLEQAIKDPLARSENIRIAWDFSRKFVQHLRQLSSAMRRVEEAIMREVDTGKFFRAFFADYVTEHLITDYKTLHTQNNPFRFRVNILDLVRRIESEDLTLLNLAKGYVNESRARNEKDAEETIRRELAFVYSTFNNIDAHLRIIGETQERIERRVSTVIRYMDRDSGSAVDRLAVALGVVGKAPFDPLLPVPVASRILNFDRPWGGDSLYVPKPPREPITRVRLREEPKDPIIEAYEAAKVDYSNRVTVTPQRVLEFLDRAMAGRDSVRAGELLVDNVDDFIVFQRLGEADVMFGGALASHYRLERDGGPSENEWLEFRDFVIHRVAQGEQE